MKKIITYKIELINVFIKTIFSGILSFNIIIPIVLSFLFNKYVELSSILIFLLLNLFIFIIRVYLWKKLSSSIKDGKPYHNILSVTAIFIVLTSLLYAYAFWSIFAYISALELSLLIAILATVVSGSIMTMGTIYNLFVVFVVSNVLPIAIMLINHGGYIYYTISSAMILFGIITLLNGYKYYNTLKESFVLKNEFQDKVIESTQELKNKNDLLSTMIETSMAMVVFHDAKGIIVSANQIASERFGYKNESEVLGQNIFAFVPDKSVAAAKEAISKGYSAPYELVLKTKDAVEFHTIVSGKNTILDSKEVRLTIIHDLTDIKDKDKLLFHQAKLAQMGEMISMIAHQWRQPLSAISSSSIALNLQSKLGTISDESILKTTDNISKYAQHLSSTIDDFRNFFKPTSNSIALTNFDKILETVVLIIKQSIISKNIAISLYLNSKDDFKSFENEIKQVVLTIIKNAEDALANNNIPNKSIKIHTYTQENNGLEYILEIVDNAGGIPSDAIDKIFDPYFSTKLDKNGTGLGLYMSKMIIEEHCKGKLEVQNVDDGAMFRITLKDNPLEL